MLKEKRISNGLQGRLQNYSNRFTNWILSARDYFENRLVNPVIESDYVRNTPENRKQIRDLLRWFQKKYRDELVPLLQEGEEHFIEYATELEEKGVYFKPPDKSKETGYFAQQKELEEDVEGEIITEAVVNPPQPPQPPHRRIYLLRRMRPLSNRTNQFPWSICVSKLSNKL